MFKDLPKFKFDGGLAVKKTTGEYSNKRSQLSTDRVIEKYTDKLTLRKIKRVGIYKEVKTTSGRQGYYAVPPHILQELGDSLLLEDLGLILLEDKI